jgi:hypothetical protein
LSAKPRAIGREAVKATRRETGPQPGCAPVATSPLKISIFRAEQVGNCSAKIGDFMRSTRKKTVTAALAFVLTLSTLVAGQAPAAAAPGMRARSAMTVNDVRLVQLVGAVITNMRTGVPRSAPAGVWSNDGESACFRCDAGLALAMAAAAAAAGNRVQRGIAEQIFDHDITAYQQTNGAFGTTPDGSDLETMFFTVELGTAAILLKPDQTPERHERWVSSVTRAADFLIRNGNLSWYTNGNIAIGNALVMALAARVTGNPLYTAHYRAAITFATAPPQARWPGFGFIYTDSSVRADGLDGKGYFTEGAADAIPGFDAEYTMLQIDFLARLYVINREPVVLRMLNMVTNELMTRVNTTTWRLNTSGGTRHPQMNREFPFDTAALAVLANLGNRPYMQRFVPSQTAAYIKAFKGDDGERLRYAVGMTAATVLMSQPGSARMR